MGKTQQLLDALAAKYPSPRYAFVPEYRGGTAWTRENRADALVMSTWPSDGLELIGFELKTSRSDWLRELKHPSKCEPIKQFCDRWYAVTYLNQSRLIIHDWKDEIPSDWGWMDLRFDGKYNIKLIREAPPLNPKPIDKPFLASLMRRATRIINEIVIDGRTYQIKE